MPNAAPGNAAPRFLMFNYHSSEPTGNTPSISNVCAENLIRIN